MSVYAHVRVALEAFRVYIDALPPRDAPSSPKETVSVDMNRFVKMAQLMRELPTSEPSNAPQFFSASSQTEIRALQVRYALALDQYSKKTGVSRVTVEQVFKGVVPNGNFAAIIQSLSSRSDTSNNQSVVSRAPGMSMAAAAA